MLTCLTEQWCSTKPALRQELQIQYLLISTLEAQQLNNTLIVRLNYERYTHVFLEIL